MTLYTPFTRAFALEDITIRSDGTGRTVEAYAAVFGVPQTITDHEGAGYVETIARTEFDRTIAQRSGAFQVMFNHGLDMYGNPSDRFSMPIGTPVEVRADAKRQLAEAKEKEQKEPKLVFVETDGREAFPEDTISALRKDIHKKAKDLEVTWKSSAELVDSAFTDLDVPKPGAFLTDRWKQYRELIDHAIKRLSEARGLKAGWMQTV